MRTTTAAPEQVLQDLTVGEVLPCLQMGPATVHVDASLDQVLDLVAGFSRPRRLYVTDGEGRLRGAIDPATLAEVLIPEYLLAGDCGRDTSFGMASFSTVLRYQPRDEARRAADIMHGEPACTTPWSRLTDALCGLRRAGVDALPVVDEAGLLLAEFSVLHAVAWFQVNASPRAGLSVARRH